LGTLGVNGLMGPLYSIYSIQSRANITACMLHYRVSETS